MSNFEPVSLQETPQNSVPYWENPFQCDCKLKQKFINFWTSSGTCCDNLRLTIWYTFNFIFLFVVLFTSYKIYKERKKKSMELLDFSEVPESERRKYPISKQPLNNPNPQVTFQSQSLQQAVWPNLYLANLNTL